MKNFLLFLILPALVFVSCSGEKKEEIDLFIYNAKIYTVDSSFSVKEAMAIDDGKIIFIGKKEELPLNFSPLQSIDAGRKAIFPGFIDAHCHFLHYGLGLQQVDLVGTKSFDEVIAKVVAFSKKNKSEWIIGRGWDQNDWEIKEYPTKDKLDSLFPETPVFLERIDGHAALANTAAMLYAKLKAETKISGGEIIRYPEFKLNIPKPIDVGNDPHKVKAVLTGVLVDNAVDFVKRAMPLATADQMKNALLAAQKNCFEVGLTTVDDAGLMKSEIDVIDALNKSGELKMRIYAMLSDSAPNYNYYLKAGPYKTDYLNVCSFKFYADGALGSRGACLKEHYSDKKAWKGFLLNTPEYFLAGANKIIQTRFQMNTHCIGDSAVSFMMDVYRKNLYFYCANNSYEESQRQNYKKERRWRIEHFQVSYPESGYNRFYCFNLKGDSALNPSDFNIIPSVQPTHATSDMYWAKERLGEKRMKYAYAYKTLLKNAGVIALGTDFPVEDISPFKTFYAAVFRKDAKGFPKGGFQIEEALTREETIRGMTIWAAYANFEEKEKGSLEKGKFADFVILDTDLMSAGEKDILKTKVLSTYLNGEKVYEKKQ